MSITLTATNPTAQTARAAVLETIGLGDLAHVREIVLTVEDRPSFAGCYCEEGSCPNRAIASTVYVDAEDGVTEAALCIDCARAAIEWLRMSDQVDPYEDLHIHVCGGWLSDTHQLEL